MSTRTGVRALVMVTLCYGALEIVGLLLLLLLLPACDRRTDILPRHIRAMHTRRAVKTVNMFCIHSYLIVLIYNINLGNAHIVIVTFLIIAPYKYSDLLTYNKITISKTVHLNDRDFVVRMLYKDCY